MAVDSMPMFRIPFLALRIILGLFSPPDIIRLSLCSKRSVRVAKQCWKKNESVAAYLSAEVFPKVNLYFRHSRILYQFVISEVKDLHKNQRTHNIRIGDAVVPSIHKVPSIRGNTQTVTFWEDTIYGIEQTVSHIKHLFDVPINCIRLRSPDYQNEFIRIMDCIMTIQGSVEDCSLGTVGPIDDCLTHVLDNCKITGKLWIFGDLSTRFRHNWNINFDGLYTLNDLRLTFQELTNMNCQSLELRDCSSLTSEDLNQFLKHWQNGGNPRIKFVSIGMKSISQSTITSGIDIVSQPEGLHRCYKVMNDSKIRKFGGLDIQRNDGTTGTIFLDDETFEFGVDPTVILQAD